MEKFDEYASREERKGNLETIEGALPEGIATQFDKEDAPGLRNKIMIASIGQSPEGPEKTRDSLVEICRRFRQPTIPYKKTQMATCALIGNATGEAQVTFKADAIKKALGDDRRERVELDLGKNSFPGLAQRQGCDSDMICVWRILNKHVRDALQKTRGNLKRNRKWHMLPSALGEQPH